jgi:hypothetical protein
MLSKIIRQKKQQEDQMQDQAQSQDQAQLQDQLQNQAQLQDQAQLQLQDQAQLQFQDQLQDQAQLQEPQLKKYKIAKRVINVDIQQEQYEQEQYEQEQQRQEQQRQEQQRQEQQRKQQYGRIRLSFGSVRRVHMGQRLYSSGHKLLFQLQGVCGRRTLDMRGGLSATRGVRLRQPMHGI